MSKPRQFLLTKALADKMPRDERLFFLLGTQLDADLSTFIKLLRRANDATRGALDRGEADGSESAEPLLLLKTLAGRLYEGKQFVNTAFAAKGLHQKYYEHLPDYAKESYRKINQYFGSKNLIAQIRNKIAFHFDVDAVDALYRNTPPGATLVEYQYRENFVLDLVAEDVTLNAILEATGEKDNTKALQTFAKETGNVAEWFGFFLDNVLSTILITHVPEAQVILFDDKAWT